MEFEDYITPSFQHITIKSDGSSVVNYYYERIKYTYYEVNYYLENADNDEYTLEETANGKVSSTSNLNAPLKILMVLLNLLLKKYHLILMDLQQLIIIMKEFV